MLEIVVKESWGSFNWWQGIAVDYFSSIIQALRYFQVRDLKSNGRFLVRTLRNVQGNDDLNQ
jgi:hypothetical protein